MSSKRFRLPENRSQQPLIWTQASGSTATATQQTTHTTHTHHSSAADTQSTAGDDCECGQQWRVWSELGDSLCVRCVFGRLADNDELNYNKIKLLSLMHTSLKYDTRLAALLAECPLTETAAILVALVLHQNDSVSSLAVKFSISLMSILKVPHFSQQLVTSVISKINDFESLSALQFICDSFPIIPDLVNYILSKDCDLISYLKSKYEFTVNNDIKSCILTIYMRIYKSNCLPDLFDLDFGFHDITIQMCFKALNVDLTLINVDLVLNALVLFQEIIYRNDFIYLGVINNKDLCQYFRKLLKMEFILVKNETSQWIYKLLQAKSTPEFANRLISEGIIENIFDSLHSSTDALLSRNLLNCLHLMFKHATYFRILKHPSFITDGINNAICLGIKINDDELCSIGMILFVKILQKMGPHKKMFNQFSLFCTFDLIEKIISKSNLFNESIRLTAELLHRNQLPFNIPVPKLCNFATKVTQDISNYIDFLNKDNFDNVESLLPFCYSVVAIIDALFRFSKSLIVENSKQMPLIATNIIASLNTNLNTSTTQPLTNAILEPELNNENLAEREAQETISFDKESVDKILNVCVQNYKQIFQEIMNLFTRFYCNSNADIIMKSIMELLSKMCGCLTFMFNENLYDHEKTKILCNELLGSKYISFLWRIMYCDLSAYRSLMIEFRDEASSALALFIMVMENYHNNQNMNENLLNDFIIGFKTIKDNETFCELMSKDWSSFHNIEKYSTFISSVFAITYYCFIYDPNFEIEEPFKELLIKYFKTISFLSLYPRITIKHSLFLLAYFDCDEEINRNYICCLFQFSSDISNDYLSHIYTDSFLMLNWSFKFDLNVSIFGEFTLRAFLTQKKLLPDQHNEYFQIFDFLGKNEKAFETLMEMLLSCDVCFKVIQHILADSHYDFIDDAQVCSAWNTLAMKVTNRLPDVIRKMLASNSVQTYIDRSYRNRLSKLIELLCKMRALSTEQLSYTQVMEETIHYLGLFMDINMNESTAATIFWYIRQSFSLYPKEEKINLMNHMLDFNSGKVALVINDYAKRNYDCYESGPEMWYLYKSTTILIECAVYLLSKIMKYSLKYRLKHDLNFTLDVKTICKWLSVRSSQLHKSALSLVANTFDGSFFFSYHYASDDNQLSSIQIRNFMLLMKHSICETKRCKYAVKCCDKILNYLLIDTNQKSLYLHVLSQCCWQLVFETLKSGSIIKMSDESVALLHLYYSQKNVNTSLTQLTNELVSTLVEALQTQSIIDEIKRKSFTALLNIIYNGNYFKELSADNRDKLSFFIQL